MARTARTTTTIGTFIPAVREEVKGVQRTEEEMKRLREEGSVAGILFAHEGAKSVQAFKQLNTAFVEKYCKDATAKGAKHCVAARLLDNLVDALIDVSWQLPEKPKAAKPVETGLDW